MRFRKVRDALDWWLAVRLDGYGDTRIPLGPKLNVTGNTGTKVGPLPGRYPPKWIRTAETLVEIERCLECLRSQELRAILQVLTGKENGNANKDYQTGCRSLARSLRKRGLM